MSIAANKDTQILIQGGAAGLNAARRMAEFCYMIKRPLNVDAFVYPPDAGKTNEVPYGSGTVTIPIYKNVADATANHPQINTSLVYIGADRAAAAGIEALNDPRIRLVSMITEGVPERDAKYLGRHALALGKIFKGPSSIGIISAGQVRLGGIGGAVVKVGEMGGGLEERAAEWYGATKRRIILLAVVSGFCQESLPKGMKFGHAGAKEGLKGEGSARSKSDALKKAGAIVPDTFGAL